MTPINPMIWPEFAIRLSCAVALGAVVGFERQWHQKMAGLKTNALVALGSGGFVMFGLAPGQANGSMIAAQIVSGIGFLGAGVIMRDGASVHGLNTAATVWCSAMVGALSGFGLYTVACFAAVAVSSTAGRSRAATPCRSPSPPPKLVQPGTAWSPPSPSWA